MEVWGDAQFEEMHRAVLAGVQMQGVIAPLVVDGATNGERFLAPNRKRAGVRAAIASGGATFLLLPPYCPDLNPTKTQSPNSSDC